jgi:hypothetical protein
MKIRKEKKTVTKRNDALGGILSGIEEMKAGKTRSIAEIRAALKTSNVYSKLIERLETDLLMARSDIQQMKQDRDQTIAELRSEKALLNAKVAMYELAINRRVGIDPAAKAPQMPNFKDFNSPPPMTRWQQEVRANDERNAKELAEEANAAKG